MRNERNVDDASASEADEVIVWLEQLIESIGSPRYRYSHDFTRIGQFIEIAIDRGERNIRHLDANGIEDILCRRMDVRIDDVIEYHLFAW